MSSDKGIVLYTYKINMRRLVLQRFETKQALREVFNTMSLGEALYKLVEIFKEIEAENN